MIRYQPNLPNNLTLFRILLIPVFIICIELNLLVWSAVVFSVAALTDYLDGFIARKYKQVSDFGKLMDPLADKILVMAALVMLVGQRDILNAEPYIPAWMVIMILARETWVTGIRSLAASGGVVMAAGSAGKIKSFLQMLAIVFLLLHRTVLWDFGTSRITTDFVGERLLMISLVFSYWSAIEYTMAVFGNSVPAQNADRE